MQNKIISFIVLVLILAGLGLVYMKFGQGDGAGPAISQAEAAETALAYINNTILQGRAVASLTGEMAEENGLYKFEVDLEGTQFFSYITKDGNLLFPEGIDLTEEEPVENGEEPPTIDIEPTYDESSHIRGDVEGAVTIIEFSDFQCPYCSRFHDTMKEVMANYQTDVKWVYKHFPLDSIHPYARKAAEASECAGEQGEFWQYADGLYENQSKIAPDYFAELAQEVGLNVDQFTNCLDSDKYADKVEADYQEGRSLGISGTPGGFINGEVLGGAVPFSTLQSKIDVLLQ